MLHFLGSVLALPLSDDSPGPLQKQQVRDIAAIRGDRTTFASALSLLLPKISLNQDMSLSVRGEMGSGFKAVAMLEAAMQNLHAETRRRLCCPLCRCCWPEEEDVPLDQIMVQLRQCRVKKLAKNVGKLEKAAYACKRSPHAWHTAAVARPSRTCGLGMTRGWR